MELDSVVYVGIIPALLSAFTWCKYRGLEYILVHYRWIFVILFLLPLSLAYDVFFYTRNWLVFKMNSAPHKHDEKVKFVQKQVCCHCLTICKQRWLQLFSIIKQNSSYIDSRTACLNLHQVLISPRRFISGQGLSWICIEIIEWKKSLASQNNTFMLE